MTENQPDFNHMLKRLTDVESRLVTVERNATDLSKSVTEIVNHHKGLQDRLTDFEKAEFKKQIEDAVAVEREKQLQKDIATMAANITALMQMNIGQVVKDVEGIKAANGKLFWLVLGSVVTGFAGIVFLVFRNGLGL